MAAYETKEFKFNDTPTLPVLEQMEKRMKELEKIIEVRRQKNEKERLLIKQIKEINATLTKK